MTKSLSLTGWCRMRRVRWTLTHLLTLSLTQSFSHSHTLTHSLSHTRTDNFLSLGQAGAGCGE